LLLGVVRVEVLALGFQDTENTAEIVHEQVIGTAVGSVVLEPDLLRVQQVPAARFKRLVNQDAGEGFVATKCHAAASMQPSTCCIQAKQVKLASSVNGTARPYCRRLCSRKNPLRQSLLLSSGVRST
jgi:hypothetical protein